MKNDIVKNICVIGVIAIIILVVAIYMVLQNLSNNLAVNVLEGRGTNLDLGAQMLTPYAYNFASTSSTTISRAPAPPTLIADKDANRINTIVCSLSSNSSWLFVEKETQTSGLRIDEGILLVGIASSTEPCRDLPGAKGYIYAVSTATTSVSVAEIK